MKILKVHPDLVPLVLAGSKTSTWRMFDDKDMQAGDELSLVDAGTKQEFARAKISSVKEKTLDALSEADWEGHERYKDDDEMLSYFRKFYGDRVTMKTPVKMIDFEL